MNKGIRSVLLIAFLLFSALISHAQNTYYWIGGQGNWSDVNHWSLSSGHSGGVYAPQVPTVLDNVVFDDNSGFTPANKKVTFNTTAAYANDFKVLTTTGTAPEFSAVSANRPYIKGDFSITAATVWNVIYVSFGTNNNTESNTIRTNGVPLKNVFFADGGIKNLADPLTLTGEVSGVAGVLRTAGHKLTVAGRFAGGSTTSTVEFGTSEVDLGNLTAPNATVTSANSIVIRSVGAGGNPALSVANNCSFNRVTLLFGGSLITSNSTFNELNLEGNSTIGGSNSIGTLNLAAAKQFTFSNGTTTTIGTLNAVTPDCVGLMEIKSGSTATISINSGTVNVPNVIITGINATGGAVFNAIGVDNGNNTGWNFITPASKNIYWVGTASDGNWNNAANWSATSGGAGGYCVPTQFDNVFFDAGSNVSVPINISGQGYCKNITIQGVLGTPNFNTGTLNIFGSSVWQAGMRYNFETYYSGETLGLTITSNGVKFLQRVYFTERAGGWIFQDAFSTDKSLFFQAGSLNTNSQTVVVAQEFTQSGGIAADLPLRQLFLGSSNITVGRWVYTQGSLNAGTSHITTTYTGSTNLYATFQATSHTYYNVTHTGADTYVILGNTIFNDVVILGSNTNSGNSTYRKLHLTGGKNYSFQNNSTTRINEEWLYSTPDCTGLPILAATTAGGARATISMPNTASSGGAPGVVAITNVKVRDINVTGGATFTATGEDLGNNNGWASISAGSPPKTLYWIGGNGEWTDVNHWTTNSDGTPSTDACIPTISDNVIFNQYSGTTAFTVTNTSALNSECNNMTWTNVPAGTIFTGNDVFIGGSLVTATGMLWKPNNTNFTASTAGQTITLNGVSLDAPVLNSNYGNVNFSGTGGWTFMDDFKTFGRVLLSSGNLNTNGKKMSASAFNYPSSGNPIPTTATLNISNSIIEAGRWSFNNTNINTANSHIYTTSDRFHSANGVTYNNVTVGTTANIVVFYGNVSFNEVVVNSNTQIDGNNTFKKLTLTPKQLTLSLAAGTTQTIQDELFINGTPCVSSTVKSVSGVANINVLAGRTEFDFVNVAGINASGLPLTFDRNSVDNGGNSNITFKTGTGGLVGLGADLTCNEIDATNPSTYTLDAKGFYGGISTIYEWKKIAGTGSSATTIIGTGSVLDISTTGYGTYRVTVNYGGTPNCTVSDDIIVSPKTVVPTAQGTQKLCNNAQATVAKLIATGSNLKWYDVANGGTALLPTTSLVNGATYFVSQTVNGCESHRVAVVVTLETCASFANPSLRNRGVN
ncbi:beta strand repeat-containing protein [Pedobacter ureilyticus]|uniref:Beta strand repeat-containing protein n=1 Tax=Pedobacter ureilyticus TaxID=1393051 RepID=A0ABW9J5Z7_9SPHI|nr:hypothetical protein [Pedobacter helvus]